MHTVALILLGMALYSGAVGALAEGGIIRLNARQQLFNGAMIAALGGVIEGVRVYMGAAH